ncbi:CLUMA_CG015719, isoform A [Clunio marinus]|uniref:CLUMA_CG015719, isoform A n=1 Tax=Clunio marinus TaxID=568069 RepID=A0A1J1IPJ9_9DIPT|nr:CLUMA_CG015719, isoform A [Clunio marinus]
MRCETINDIEKIFHEPYYVNLKKVLSKAQRLMEKCPPEIHPRLHMKPFTPLTRDEYQKFENYPKHLSDNKVNEIDSLRMEQKILDAKLVEMEAFEKSINTRLENHLIDAEYEQRMREIESSYAKALEEEEERITCQRKMLLLSLKKIREHENETLIHTRNSLLRKQVEASESELESMLRNLQKQRIREEIELQMAEENLKLKEMSQRMQNFEIDTSMRSGTLESRHKTSIESIKSQKQRLMDQLKQLESTTSSTNSTSKVFDGKGEGREETERNCESSFQKIENNFDLMVGKNGRKEDYISRMKKLEIAEKVLEDELHHLLENSDK